MADKMGNTQFKFGYWWVNNKTKILKLIKYLLFGVIAIIGVTFLLYLLQYLINFNQASQYMSQISGQEINYAGTSQPSAIESGNSYSFSASNDKADLMGVITNPNPDWSAKTLLYTFTGGGGTSQPVESFILPGETKTLSDLGVPSSGTGTSKPKLVITDTEWIRKKQDLPELNFEFKDLEYQTAEPVSSDGAAGSIVSGTVLNKSAFGFYETKVTVVLMYSGVPVGVGVTRINDFKSFEERPIELRFPDRYPIGVDMIPEIEVNILDEDNLIYPGQ